MAALDRAYWLSVAVCAYTAAAALSTGGFSWLRVTVAALSPLLLALIWRATHQREKRVELGIEPSAFRALRVVAAGSVVWLLSRLGEPQAATLELVGVLGLGSATVAAVYALARIPATEGLLPAPRATRSVDAAAFAGAIWSATLFIAASELLVPDARRLDPLTLDYAVTAASIGSLLILFAASLRLRWLRRLELGVGDRAAGALVFSVTALAVAIPAAAANVGPPDRVLPAALLLANLCVLGCVTSSDARLVSMALRGTIVLAALGVPVVLLSASLARATPDLSGRIVLFACAASIVVGLLARAAARPLQPEQSRWLSALANASVASLVPEPQQAITRTLLALKGTSTSPDAKPALWRRDPSSVLSVNVAGTLEERDAEAPSAIYQLGEREPERTLRAEVLRLVQVRRPEVRPLLAWFEAHKAFSATIVADEDGPLGFLLLPAGDRSEAMTLEEARAARLLADRLSALLGVTSALERARRRQLEAQREASEWEASYHRVERMLQGATERHREFASALARPLVVTSYSAAVRLSFSEMERLARSAQVITLVTPVGVRAESWAARLHLSLPDVVGPLCVVEAANSMPGDERRWTDEARSPVALSEGGTLFIRDVDLLSEAEQQALLTALTQRWEERTRSGVPPPRWIASLRRHPSLLAQEGGLSLLLPWLSKHVFELPTLAERPEDLRAMILDLASKTTRGPDRIPLGVERSALQALLDHPWPGNEAELGDVVERAASLSSGPVITVADLRAIGFIGLSEAGRPEGASEPVGSLDRPEHRPRSRRPRPRTPRW